MRTFWKILNSLFYLFFLACIGVTVYFLIDPEWYEILGNKFFFLVLLALQTLIILDNWTNMLGE